MAELKNFKEEKLSDSLTNQAIELLEWPILRSHISEFSSTPMGKKAILAAEIPSSLNEAQNLLNETLEMSNLENKFNEYINFEGVYEITKSVELCAKGGIINTIDLLEIADTISSFRRLKRIIFDLELRPILSSFLDSLIDHNQIEKILKRGIENNGRISDFASDKLNDLRQKFNLLKSSRRKILDKFIINNHYLLQDSTIGDRFGRPVIAIKVNQINNIKGIIHDSSASGNTVFIEPEVIVAKGNEINSLKARITKEEFQLLKKWSKIISDNSNSLISNSNIILRIENALTRSRYSNWIGGKPPKFDNDLSITIKGFTHPLLIWEHKKNNSKVPKSIDFLIDNKTKVIAITGPNTGGKTAALKGLGIALLMAKSGLFIPSSEAPKISFYKYIYADIGDDQSLEHNLSTFSGHISRIKKILDAISLRDGLSIVLLDEIGSGTDPEEGTALAISLLYEFAKKSDLTMVTTHYGEIKALKYKDSRFENVSVSFDEESLQPTFTLNWGIPGRSNALSIARKIGLEENIINSAFEHLKPKETENINKIIRGLEEQKIKQQNAAEEAAALIARTEILYEEIDKNYKYQKLKAKEFQAKERENLTKLINQAKIEVINLIEKLRNKDASGEDSRKIGIRLKELEKQYSSQEKKYERDSTWCPQIGELIKIKSLNSHGKIIDMDDKGLSFTVNCGSFNSLLSIDDLEGLNGEKPFTPKSKISINAVSENYSFSKVRTSKNTIDVRGLRVHEAEIVIEEKMRKFHGPLWIIHGIGTGKLKRGLKLWLSKLDYIDKIEDAEPSEGGSGCSIAWIK
tara:strand:- start:2977 stop:5391 length:2415 start_codon:yes stop_codon:yes gene_type:complete